MKWKRLISEEEIPSSKKSILASFKRDVSNQKFSPTREFLEIAYDIFNTKFFGGELPENIQFQVKTQPTKSYVGLASYMYDNRRNKVWATAITLNGSRTLTSHEWLEVVLHEMIHVLDYETNPEHFLGYMGRSYDVHGSWFLNYGKKFWSEGFHVQKYCNAEIGVNTSDTKIKNRINKSVFLYMKGDAQRPLIMKMSRSNLDRNLEYIISRIGRGSTFGIGVKEIKIMTSENPNISMLKDLRMRDSTSRISWWWFNDDFDKKYGPFELEDTVKLLSAKNRMNEDDNEPEEIIDDRKQEDPEEVIDEICDNVNDVEEVKNIGNDKFIVSIP